MRNQSLVSQDFDVEVIVVDDGSRDGTARVVEEFVHSHPDKVRLVRLERNMGLGNARNVGVSLARGSVVVFLDADMEFQPDFVRRLTEPILSGKTLATCHSTEIVGNACNPWVKAQGQKIRGFPQAARTGSIRAVDKRFFLQSGGFDASKGYFDDTSFHEKTGLESVVVDVSLIHRNPDTVREIFWRNRWIGRSVLKAHKLVEVLVMVGKRLFDLMPFAGFLLLFSADLAVKMVGVVSLLLFGLVVARHRALPSESLWEGLKVRFIYVPAYRWVKALGFLTGVVEALLGRGWEEAATRVDAVSEKKSRTV